MSISVSVPEYNVLEGQPGTCPHLCNQDEKQMGIDILKLKELKLVGL